MIRKISVWKGLVAALVFTSAGCASFDKTVLHSVDDMLSKDGSGTVFTGDNDPQLVGDALPFAIKMYESLYVSDPTHAGMAKTLGMMYIVYAHAYVAGPAETLGDDRFTEKQAAQKRALNLFLRGRDYALNAVDLRHPGFKTLWNTRNKAALANFLVPFQRDDVPYLYWLAAGQMSALSLQPMAVELSLPVPLVLVCVDRAYDLDPNFQKSALDELMVSVYGSLPGSLGGNPALAEAHYDLAQKKTGGRSTGACLAYALSLDLPRQNKTHFVEMLNTVLAVDPAANPGTTLATILDQDKARWYLAQVNDLFVE